MDRTSASCWETPVLWTSTPDTVRTAALRMGRACPWTGVSHHEPDVLSTRPDVYTMNRTNDVWWQSRLNGHPRSQCLRLFFSGGLFSSEYLHVISTLFPIGQRQWTSYYLNQWWTSSVTSSWCSRGFLRASWWRHWAGSSLVQVIACHLLSAMQLHKPMPTHCQFNPWGTNFGKICIQIQ